MQVRDILYAAGDYWIGRMPTQYTVYKNGATHATADSSYAKTDDGLSIAKARCNYLAKKTLDTTRHT